jgi:hypothetical protein
LAVWTDYPIAIVTISDYTTFPTFSLLTALRLVVYTQSTGL